MFNANGQFTDNQRRNKQRCMVCAHTYKPSLCMVECKQDKVNMMYSFAKKIFKDGVKIIAEVITEFKNKEAFVILVKNNEEHTTPFLEVTIKTTNALDAVVLAGHIVNAYRDKFDCEPIVEFMPFLKGGDADEN